MAVLLAVICVLLGTYSGYGSPPVCDAWLQHAHTAKVVFQKKTLLLSPVRPVFTLQRSFFQTGGIPMLPIATRGFQRPAFRATCVLLLLVLL